MLAVACSTRAASATWTCYFVCVSAASPRDPSALLFPSGVVACPLSPCTPCDRRDPPLCVAIDTQSTHGFALIFHVKNFNDIK